MNPLPQRTPEKGFALIISLALMGFIFLLLLAMMTLASVEIHSGSLLLKKARAEQNALFALNIALAELQKTTGPDQRITARADLEFGSTASQANWTGVYGHALTPDYDLTPVEIANEWAYEPYVNDKGSAAKVLSWLVSGNSNESTWPDFTSAGALADPDYAATLPYLPNATVSNLTIDTLPNSDEIRIADSMGNSTPARLLVGSGSAGSVDDYVVAPLVSIESESGQGFSDSYAWWIGDENVKARANLEIETEAANLSNAFTQATRSAIELMTQGDEDGALDETTIGTWYDPYSDVERMQMPEEFGMLSIANPEDISPVLKQRFQDISYTSASLLTDSFAGGLKRDLSTLLSASYSPPSGDPTADDQKLWTLHPDDTTGYGVPTWKHLRSFYQTRVPDGRVVEARLPTFDKPGYEDDVGVSPALTYFAIGMGFTRDGDTIMMNLYPMVVLWNPYNFTIKAPNPTINGANFEAGIMFTREVAMGIDVYDPEDPTDLVGSSYLWRNVGNVDLRKNIEKSSDDPNDSDLEFIRFGLNCPDIPPGQSLIFAVPSSKTGDNYEDYVVLENIDPVNEGYVSVPVAELDKPYDDSTNFRVGPRYSLNYLGNPSKSLSIDLAQDGDGGIFTYLGVPRTDRIIASYSSSKFIAEDLNPSTPGLEWYQALQNITWDNAVVAQTAEESVLVQTSSGEIVITGDPNTQISMIMPERALSSSPDISYIIAMHALFSGDGTNALTDANQFMFPTRWIAQGNMRATRNGRTRRDNNYLPLYVSVAGSYAEGTNRGWNKFNMDDGDNSLLSAGSGHDWIDGAPVDATLFEFLPEDQPLLSIGQLQHANLSLIGSYPSYPIGNSLADYRLHEKSTSGSILPAEEYQLARTDSVNSIQVLKEDMEGYYDISYLLNRNLWDAYFVSSKPETGALPDALPNPRIQHDSSPEISDPDKAATHMELVGGFNINSTSEQAWRAVLGGVKGLQYDPQSASFDSANEILASFPRFTRPTSDETWTEPWQGYRTLTDEQIAQLARNIVLEIKNRGPFISLGDFINRRLVDNPSTNDSVAADTSYEHEDFRGAIQVALDRTLSSGTNAPPYAVNDANDTFWVEDDTPGHPSYHDQFGGGSKFVYNRSRLQGGDVERKPYSNRSAFSPKYVTQADVLSTIGASLTARSDTFTIRAYGEVSSDFNDEKVGAWCEAVVQRIPEYVDATDTADVAPSTETNRTFGRQYKLISFRWLNADEV